MATNTTTGAASKMTATSRTTRRGPSNKNLNSRRRPQGAQAPGQANTSALKGPDKGTG